MQWCVVNVEGQQNSVVTYGRTRQCGATMELDVNKYRNGTRSTEEYNVEGRHTKIDSNNGREELSYNNYTHI